MAVLTGISGMGGVAGIGDSTTNGAVALDLKQRILRILTDNYNMAYRTATIADIGEINAGSVSYQVPEILQASNYGDGSSGNFQKLNSSLVTININIRRRINYTYEQFDYSRLGTSAGVVGVIAASVASSIQNDLNSHFWNYLKELFDLTNGTLRTQNFTLPTGLLPDLSNIAGYTVPTAEEVKAFILRLQLLGTKISKTYNMNALGINKAEMMLYLAPEMDSVIRLAYYNQPNGLAERQIAKDLVGYQLGGGLYYYLDKMLGNSIPVNTSFSEDTALDLTKFAGFYVHNEAVAMPFNFMSSQIVTDQENGNPRFINKYQFGIGVLRPSLIYSITTEAPA